MSTFREAVEEIVCPVKFRGRCKDCKEWYGYSECPEKETLDRILAAYKAKVEGMPEVTKDVHQTCEHCQDYVIGVGDEYEACKKHLLKEIEE